MSESVRCEMGDRRSVCYSGSDKGKRLIIMHAMTRDGMLDESKQQTEVSDNLQEKAASAGIVSAKLSSEGFEPEDYHDTLNGEKFVAWLTNRLLTAFEDKYGKRARMVLILDNAKYHHARGEDWVNVREWNAIQLGNYLRTAKVKENTVERKKKENGVTSMVKLVIPASKFTADVRECETL